MREHRTRHIPGVWLALMALVVVLTTACGPDDYGPCTLPRSDALADACQTKTSGGEDGQPVTESNPNCVIDFVFECEHQLCGTFNGSPAFCTQRCDGAADTTCPKGGYCLEWVPGIGEYFCVDPALIETVE